MVIASDQDGRLELPARAAVSVITLGELRAGVLRARDPLVRSARAARLDALRRAFFALDVNADVADHYGIALAHARDTGRTAKASDLLIIATAGAAGRTLYTFDAAQAALARDLGLSVEAL